MNLDTFAARIALYVELYAVSVLLLFPFDRVGPYNRSQLEQQVIGCGFILSRGQRIPAEAMRMYSPMGKVIIALVVFDVLRSVAGTVSQSLG